MSGPTRWPLIAAAALLAVVSTLAAQGPEEQACQGGDGQACFQVGMRHLGNMDNGPSVQRSMPYFTKACEGGVPKACFALGGIYQTGQATGLGIPEDLPRAKSLFQRACSGGFTPGCTRAGELENPSTSTTARRPTPEEEAGCTRGNGDNCWTVALYLVGDMSDPAKVAQAAPALETACNGNVGNACVALALAYESGTGVSQDLSRAVALLTKGCDVGVTLSCREKDRVAGAASTAPPAATGSAPQPAASPEPSFAGIRMGMSQDAVRSVLGNPLSRSSSSGGGEIWVYRNRTLGVTFDMQGAVVHLLAMGKDAGRFEGVRVNDDMSKINDLCKKRGWKLDDFGAILMVTTPQWTLLVNGTDGKISMLTWSAATGN